MDRYVWTAPFSGCAPRPACGFANQASRRLLPLFNGKDLTGRNPPACRLESRRRSPHRHPGRRPEESRQSRHQESYRDFELELEFQLDEHGKYNSGATFAAADVQRPSPDRLPGQHRPRRRRRILRRRLHQPGLARQGRREGRDPSNPTSGTACASSPPVRTRSLISTGRMWST